MSYFQGFLIVIATFASLVWQAVKSIFTGANVEPKPIHREVDCSGCNGTGTVTYGPDHEFVKLGLAEPGTYPCSYCGGSGKLVEEIR